MNIKYYTLKNGVLPRTFLNSGRLTKKHDYECKNFVINLKVLHDLPSYENNILLNTGLCSSWNFLSQIPPFCVWNGGNREFDPKCCNVPISNSI